MIFSLSELFDIVIMSLAIGFLFKDIVIKQERHEEYDPLKQFSASATGFGAGSFHLDNFKFAMIATAPAIILHELGHKFAAMGFGATAEFHAYYAFLMLAVLLKLINSEFIFIVPAYVSWSGGNIGYFQASAIAFAGPLVNLLLWLFAWALLRYFKRNKSVRRHTQLLVFTKQINLFLFIFNMIPLKIFGIRFDGYTGFINLLKGFGLF